MASAADIIMAPVAPRPDTGAVRKDTPAAEADDTSFADVLGAEVEGAADVEAASDVTPVPAATVPEAPPAQPVLPAKDAVELLLSLQSAGEPDSSAGPQETAGTAAPASPTASAPAVVIPAASIETADSTLASAVSTPETAQQTTLLPPTPVEMVAPAPAATPPAATVAATAPAMTAAVKSSQAVIEGEKKDAANPENETAIAAAPLDAGSHAIFDVSAQPAAASAPSEPLVLPQTPANATSTEASAVMTVVATPRQAPTTAPEHAPEPSTDLKSAATPDAATPDLSEQYSRAAADGEPTSNQPTANGAKPQANAQAVKATDATPEIKTSAPSPAPGNTPVSVADVLANGRGTDTAKAATPAPLQSAPQTVVQVYTRFVERFDGRAQRFEVRLDPAELGRVDVRIEIGADRKVHAVLAAHDSAALTDLMRGQRALERALADAGIDLKDGGVKFELANDSGRGPAGGEQRRDPWSGEDGRVWRAFGSTDVVVEASAADVAAAANTYSRRGARLDLVA